MIRRFDFRVCHSIALIDNRQWYTVERYEDGEWKYEQDFHNPKHAVDRAKSLAEQYDSSYLGVVIEEEFF